MSEVTARRLARTRRKRIKPPDPWMLFAMVVACANGAFAVFNICSGLTPQHIVAATGQTLLVVGYWPHITSNGEKPFSMKPLCAGVALVLASVVMP